MPSIGDTLREARMRQRLDIADVESRTKIRAKYLRALENEEFGLLPGSTFVRTFLRTYAEVLGLDPHVLVEEYRTKFEPRDELELPVGPTPGGGDGGGRLARARRLTEAAGPGRGTIIAAALAGLLIGLIVLGVTANNDDGNGKKAAQTTTGKEKRQKKRKRRPKPAPAVVSLQVAPNGPTYVCVTRGPAGETVFQGTISEPQTFKGKKLRINLGRTAVELRVNGKPFPVKQVANPVGYEFSSTGSKELVGPERPTCSGTSTPPVTTPGV
jgi:cytoskeleton protein RodZ